MFWFFLIVGGWMVFRFLQQLHVRCLSRQMRLKPGTVRAVDQEEMEVRDLAVDYMLTVVLNARNLSVRRRKMELVMFNALSATTVFTVLSVFVERYILYGRSVTWADLSVAGVVLSFTLFLAFLVLRFLEIAGKKHISRNMRIENWFSKHLPTDVDKLAFVAKANRVYRLGGDRVCRQPTWAFPDNEGAWLDLSVLLLVLALVVFGAISTKLNMPYAMYPGIFVLVLSILAGMPARLFLKMRLAPWDGIAAGEISLPLCFLLENINAHGCDLAPV